LAAGLIMAATGLVYSNAWQGAFVFDDISAIVENPYLRDLHHLPVFFTGGRFTNPFRAIPAITFALNYQIHRLAVEGDHLVNILLHAVNGLLVAMLVHSLLSLNEARESSPAGIDPSCAIPRFSWRRRDFAPSFDKSRSRTAPIPERPAAVPLFSSRSIRMADLEN
jgi:hypothetical protein